ncbi:MAG TPA: peptide deformylase [Anaerolineales bacterium]|jgi:peptide deformylase
MSILEIVTLPDPVLRTQASKVHAFTSELRQLAADMVETMRAAPGVGLAAPQIGLGQRVIVVEYAEPPDDPEAEPPTPKLYRLVNPQITRRSAETVMGNEGCLSIPGFYGEVERHQAVTVRGFTPEGDPALIEAEGWLARIFQHEIDHTNGILFPDRAIRVWKLEEDEAAEVRARA